MDLKNFYIKYDIFFYCCVLSMCMYIEFIFSKSYMSSKKDFGKDYISRYFIMNNLKY